MTAQPNPTTDVPVPPVYNSNYNPLLMGGQLVTLMGQLMQTLNDGMLKANQNISDFLSNTLTIAKYGLEERQSQASNQQNAGIVNGGFEIAGGVVSIGGGALQGVKSAEENFAVNKALEEQNPMRLRAVAMNNAVGNQAEVDRLNALPRVAPLTEEAKTNIREMVALEIAPMKNFGGTLAQAGSPLFNGMGAMASSYPQAEATRHDGLATVDSSYADVARTQLGMIDGLKQSQQSIFDGTANTIDKVLQAIIATSRAG